MGATTYDLPVLRGLKQDDSKFTLELGYKQSSRPAWAISWDWVSNAMLKGEEYSIVVEHLPGNHKALSSTPVLRRIQRSCPSDWSSPLSWDSPTVYLGSFISSTEPCLFPQLYRSRRLSPFHSPCDLAQCFCHNSSEIIPPRQEHFHLLKLRYRRHHVRTSISWGTGNGWKSMAWCRSKCEGLRTSELSRLGCSTL